MEPCGFWSQTLIHHKACHICPWNGGIKTTGICCCVPIAFAGSINQSSWSDNHPILQSSDHLFLLVFVFQRFWNDPRSKELSKEAAMLVVVAHTYGADAHHPSFGLLQCLVDDFLGFAAHVHPWTSRWSPQAYNPGRHQKQNIQPPQVFKSNRPKTTMG